MPSARRVLAQVDRWDKRLFDRAARVRGGVLDDVLPRLTRSADHGALWLATAALLGTWGGRPRRAAVRGVASLTVASFAANVPLKLAARRSRPVRSAVPMVRLLARSPSSSSFPSGHAASAAAFATGVALEVPALGAPVALLAGGVAYGRVHTGVHYPGDVAAGAAVGLASALLVRRVWPVRPARPSAVRTAVDAPAAADGEGFVLVANPGAGSAEMVDDVERELLAALPKAELLRADDIEAALRAAARRARILGVMGGDGTVSCAAGIALEAGLPLAVVPGGTLNHFARELGITGIADVIGAVRDGQAVHVSVASSSADGSGDFFLNTFAIGIYPDLVRERERHEQALGKWPALALALARIARRARPIDIEVGGQRRRLWTLFAGNGHYHPAGFAPSWRERIDDDAIDVRMVDATAPLARARLVLAVLSGRLGRSAVHEQRIVGRLRLRLPASLHVARDGEVFDADGDLVLQAAAEPLVVYRPA